jgi:drug/metabolite transporter (DMT)-like permease
VTRAEHAPDDAPAVRPRRGSVSLYAVAFALMGVAGIILVVASLGSLNSIGLLWISAGFSAAAVVAAVASAAVPRR